MTILLTQILRFFKLFLAQSFALELLFVNLETKMCSQHRDFEVEFFRCPNFQYL